MRKTSDAAAQIWRERIEAQRAGGLSIRAWCRGNNCHEHAFYVWRSRLGLSPAPAARLRSPQATKRRDAQRGLPSAAAGSVGFAQAVVDVDKAWVSAAVDGSIRLCLAEGRELVLPASLPPVYLAQLIRAIEGQPPIIREPA